MAIWIKKRTPILDPYRTGGSGEMVTYGCDSAADINNLPPPDGKNMSSTALVLDGTYYELGSDINAGINGWRQM